MSGWNCKSRLTWLVFEVFNPFGRVKETQSEAKLNEWTSASRTHELWVYLWISIKFYYHTLLQWCLSCNTWRLTTFGIAWLNQMDGGIKSRRTFLLYNYSVCYRLQSAIGLSWCTRRRNVASKIKFQWTTQLKNETHWRTECKSAAILCPVILWNVILCVNTKWRRTPRHKIQQSFWKWIFNFP